jgi:hypothetical protein
VVIKEDGTLDITYSCTVPTSVAYLDSTTGELSLKKNSETTYDYSVVFNSESAGRLPAITGKIEFGYKETQVGYYAYADGTFSPPTSYVGNRTLVGIVYAKQTNPLDSSKIDLAILSNKTVTGRIAPDLYTYDGTTFN